MNAEALSLLPSASELKEFLTNELLLHWLDANKKVPKEENDMFLFPLYSSRYSSFKLTGTLTYVFKYCSPYLQRQLVRWEV